VSLYMIIVEHALELPGGHPLALHRIAHEGPQRSPRALFR